MMKISIFGAGNNCKKIIANIKNKREMFTDEVVSIVDNDCSLWGSFVEKIEVMNPVTLSSSSADIIVVSMEHCMGVKEQIIAMGISEEKVMLLPQYYGRVYAEYQYNLRYGSDIYEKGECGKKIIVYTAITGDYDDLSTPLYSGDDVDYVCFTNNRSVKSSIWNIEYIDDPEYDNRTLAKKVKMFPEKFIEGYEDCVWIDGKFRIKDNFADFLRKYKKSKSMICFPHFERNCVYEEAAACISLKKGEKEAIIRQICKYYIEGYPFNNGLYEMGCFARKLFDEELFAVMKAWWNEMNETSSRDQISFPYICSKYNFLPDICDLNINYNKWIDVKPHTKRMKTN